MADEAQAQAVQELDRVWKELLNRYKASKKAFRRFRRQTSPKGVYMWGGVGRGKTWLMDHFMSQCRFVVKRVCIFIISCNMFIKS
ncbi:Cell division protein ZapE [compost metagenome]